MKTYNPINNINPLIEAHELFELFKNENLVIIDAGNGKAASDNYAGKHIDQALFVDLNTMLSLIKEDAADGGRHPLPSIDAFLATLSSLGIGEESHVVIYDTHSGANAATRFWWMLKAVGLQKVQVLNGGFQAAERAGLPVNDRPVKPKVAEALNADRWQLPLADIREVEQYSGQNDRLIIDVREPKRYKGEFEPIDTIAGHIPGAINIPFASNLDESGCFLSKSALKEKYNSVFRQISPENTIVHCGSGVTACHTLFALNYAGFDIPKLYVGSWSEWSRNDKPIGKE